MILWVDGDHDPAENMRRDAALLETAGVHRQAVLRLFRFRPWGITLGRNQVAERELDLGRCARDGVRWAVRPTGGRAIFHAEEWTYSLSAPLDDPRWGGPQAATYRVASELIVRSLRRLGVPASLARSERSHPEVPRKAAGPAAPCFASAARHEVVLDGRKLVGSAQRRTAEAMLQQGSVLLGNGHLRLADYLAAAPDRRRTLREELALGTRHAGRWLEGEPLDRWAEAIEAEVGSAVRRLEGAAGLFLLTLENRASYTAPFSQAE